VPPNHGTLGQECYETGGAESCYRIRLVQLLKLKKSQIPIRSSFDAAAEVEVGDLLSSFCFNLTGLRAFRPY
jgi:hypothetical protein